MQTLGRPNKVRVNLSFSREERDILKSLSRRDSMPLATKVKDLVNKAMEIEEDLALLKIVHEREGLKQKYIKHETFWSKILK